MKACDRGCLCKIPEDLYPVCFPPSSAVQYKKAKMIAFEVGLYPSFQSSPSSAGSRLIIEYPLQSADLYMRCKRDDAVVISSGFI